jgi:hypothetical protein
MVRGIADARSLLLRQNGRVPSRRSLVRVDRGRVSERDLQRVQGKDERGAHIDVPLVERPRLAFVTLGYGEKGREPCLADGPPQLRDGDYSIIV